MFPCSSPGPWHRTRLSVSVRAYVRACSSRAPVTGRGWAAVMDTSAQTQHHLLPFRWPSVPSGTPRRLPTADGRRTWGGERAEASGAPCLTGEGGGGGGRSLLGDTAEGGRRTRRNHNESQRIGWPGSSAPSPATSADRSPAHRGEDRGSKRRIKEDWRGNEGRKGMKRR